MNTVIFSDYDCSYRSSALLLMDGVDWGLIDKNMYERQISHADEIVDYDDEKLFAFFENLFNAEVKRIVIIIDGQVAKVRCNCPRGFFGYEMFSGEVEDAD